MSAAVQQPTTLDTMFSEAQGYYAYVRKSDEWVLVHRARCRFPTSMRAANGFGTCRTGEWFGPFATRPEVFDYAEKQGFARVRACSYCKP